MIGDGGRKVEHWSVLGCKGDAVLYVMRPSLFPGGIMWAFGGRKIMKMLFLFCLFILFLH